ncbi:MAG: hypothetical protein SVR94_11365 [Pseudomonadota bacterium]|nr:hypothetical protein [Pseudomonadota bacterium]
MIIFDTFEQEIQQVFGLKKIASVTEHQCLPQHQHLLKYSGYPTLSGIWWFLTLNGLKQWQTQKNIYFPNKCCVCLTQAQYFLGCYEHTGFWRLGRRNLIVDAVPHCAVHGQQRHSQLIAHHYTLRVETVIMITLIGLNAEFLIETFDLNQTGDVIPPWQAFPEYPLGSVHWRQGAGEFWWDNVWQSFWKQQGESARHTYLNRHCAPQTWRVYLTYAYLS